MLSGRYSGTILPRQNHPKESTSTGPANWLRCAPPSCAPPSCDPVHPHVTRSPWSCARIPSSAARTECQRLWRTAVSPPLLHLLLQSPLQSLHPRPHPQQRAAPSCPGSTRSRPELGLERGSRGKGSTLINNNAPCPSPAQKHHVHHVRTMWLLAGSIVDLPDVPWTACGHRLRRDQPATTDMRIAVRWMSGLIFPRALLALNHHSAPTPFPLFTSPCHHDAMHQ